MSTTTSAESPPLRARTLVTHRERGDEQGDGEGRATRGLDAERPNDKCA